MLLSIGGCPQLRVGFLQDKRPPAFLECLAIASQDRVEKAQALGSAGKIVEFMLGLSGAEPGPFSECLASVYQYALAAILKGNAGDDSEAIAAARCQPVTPPMRSRSGIA